MVLLSHHRDIAKHCGIIGKRSGAGCKPAPAYILTFLDLLDLENLKGFLNYASSFSLIAATTTSLEVAVMLSNMSSLL